MKTTKKLFNWLDEKTKTLEKLYIRIVFAVSIPSFIALFVIIANKEHISENVFNILTSLIPLIIVLSLFILPLLMFVRLLLAVKNGIHNLRECDDELFEKIDCFDYVWEDNNTTYMNKIRIINLYYKDSGKVDELVQNKEIDRLYARKSFLSVRINSTQDLIMCFYSLVLSVIASAIFQLSQYENPFTVLFNLIAIFMVFFVLVFIRYYKRGNNGSYAFQVEEYELKLLSEKIAKLENTLQADEQDEMILITQQMILNDLINKKKQSRNKKLQKSLIKDIKLLGTLNLSLENCDNYKLFEISFNENTGYMAYSLDENGEKNGFPTKSFEVFNEIIEKYNKVN